MVAPQGARAPIPWDAVAVVSAGGVIGAEARYAVAEAWPHQPTAFAWSTVLINGTGCVLIGVLMVIVLELTSPHRLARPFLGVGVLGGYTTFSTFAVDGARLLHAHRYLVTAGYLAATLVACLAGVVIGTVAARAAGRPRGSGGMR
jgi:CrcB protein